MDRIFFSDIAQRSTSALERRRMCRLWCRNERQLAELFGVGGGWMSGVVRVFGTFIAIAIAIVVLQPWLSSAGVALAENGELVFVPESAFSQSSLEQQSQANLPTFSLSLPGGQQASELQVVDNRPLSIPIFDAAGTETARVGAVVSNISDFQNTTGTVVQLTDAPESGVYGVFQQTDGLGNQAQWQLEPTTSASSGLHVITQVGETPSASSASCDSALSLHTPLERQEYSALAAARAAQHSAGFGETTQLLQQGTQTRWREIEVIVVAPGDFTQGRTEQEVVQQIISTIAGANLYYEPLGLVIRLAGIQLFRPGPSDPYAVATQQRDALGMLEQVRSEWTTRTLPEHDVVAVFARSSFSGVFGYAYPSATCIVPEFSYLFVTQGRSDVGGELGLVSTFAHELGHLIGMNHDTSFSAGGPSMMWPFFVLQPTGFSDFSTTEFSKHESNGGATCFREIPAPFSSLDTPPPKDPNAPFGFTADSLAPIVLQEGQDFRKTLAVNGAVGPVFFRASNLPAGARINPSTGVLEYRPSSEVALAILGSTTVDVTLTAATASQTTSALVPLTVLDVNRPPKLLASWPDYVEIDEGSNFALVVTGADLDRGDSVALSLINAASTARYSGQPQFNAVGAFGELLWSIPIGTRGSFQFSFAATDLQGASAVKTITVQVVAQNAAPVVTAPENVEVGTDEVAKVLIEAVDPEGAPLAMDFLGLPPGAIVRLNGTAAEVRYHSRSSLGEQVRFEVSAYDGRKLGRAVVKLAFAAGTRSADLGAGLWPGVANPALSSMTIPANGFELYDSSTGVWTERSCEGNLINRKQFGGFLGDQPLTVVRSGQRRRAIYRSMNGQGFWYLETAGEPEVHAWGLANDVPVPGDYDGDGETDLAVYRPESGQWYLRFTSMPEQVLHDTALGFDSDAVRFPFAADIDGDGFDDRLLFSRKSDGTIAVHVYLATGDRYVFALDRLSMVDGALPIVADIDGDGRADFALRKNRGGIAALLSHSAETRKLAGVRGVLATEASCAQGGLALLNGQNLQLLGPQATIAASSDLGDSMKMTETTVNLELARRSYRLTKPSATQPSQIAVYRPDSSGTSGQWLLKTATSALGFEPLRAAEGYPFSADFFNEGRARLGLYSGGQWFFQQTGAQEFGVSWGEIGDVPVPGDYNGDGRPDIAVYRPEDGSWWVLYRDQLGKGTPELLSWGQIGDIPVPGDYDGNGSTDLAVWRPSTGEWFVRYGDGRVETLQFGLPGDVPVPGSYLAPGQTQAAVFRPSLGEWYVRSSLGTVQRQWGLPGDIPLRGDFDGNGRTDLAVFRPSDGGWYMRSLDSLNETATAVQFGLPGDIPLGFAAPKRVF